MSHKNEEPLLFYINTLKGNENFDKYVEGLRLRKKHYEAKFNCAVSPQLEWIQGRHQEVSELLDLIDNSRVYLDKIQKGKEKG